MNEQPRREPAPEPDAGGGAGVEAVGEALRAAVDRTLAVTADSATDTRRRARDLLDDVVRRGQATREQVTRRGEEATSKLADAIGELRTADSEELGRLEGRLERMERRLSALERSRGADPHLRPEPETSLPIPHRKADPEE